MSDPISQLAARLDALHAAEEIRQLKARYWRSIDAGALVVVADCLTDDVSIDFQGMPATASRADFLDQIRGAVGVPGAYHVHHGHNPEIRLTAADRAEGRWDVHYRGIDLTHRIVIDMAGAYEDRYAQVDGRWLISAMRMRQTSFLSRSIDENGTPRIVGWPGEAALTVETSALRDEA